MMASPTPATELGIAVKLQYYSDSLFNLQSERLVAQLSAAQLQVSLGIK